MDTAVFSSDWIEKVLGMNQTSKSESFGRIWTDSRTIQSGDLFVPIVGEKFDGHDFIHDALRKGASGVVCKKGNKSKAPVIFEVEDTLAAFRALAQGWREKFSIPVIAVCGSVGKTSTKEMLAAILTGHYQKVHKTLESQNGEIGIPMTILGIRANHEVAVVEVGIDEPGAMQRQLQIVKPTHAIVTAIAEEHMEKLKNLETVAQEELLCFSDVISRGGMVAVNESDPWVRDFSVHIPESQKRGFSLGPKAGYETSTGMLKLHGYAPIKAPLPGKHHATNLLGAICIAQILGLSEPEIIKGLGAFRGAKGRLEIHEVQGGLTLIGDYYNASPASMKAGIHTAASIHARKEASIQGYLVLILADMLELGESEMTLHESLAISIAESHADSVYLYGPRMKALGKKLSGQGKVAEVIHFHDQGAMIAHVLAAVRLGDTILVKGSRGMKMENVFDSLRERFKHSDDNIIPLPKRLQGSD